MPLSGVVEHERRNQMRTVVVCAVAMLLLWEVCTAQTNAIKTDLARDVFVEYSQTDFQLGMTNRPGGSRAVTVFDLTAGAELGPCTLVCFIDGKLWRTQPFSLPGEYSLNLRGLSAGEHRITLQVINTEGRVGSATQLISTEP